MARVVSRTVDSIVKLHVDTIKTDGSALEKVLSVGDIVENLRYVKDRAICSATGKITNFIMQSLRYSTKYKADSKDDIDKRLLIEDVVVDASKQYASDIPVIFATDILEDEGVEDVKRMKVRPEIMAHVELSLTDETTNAFDLIPETLLKNAVILRGPGKADLVGTFRVITLLYTMKKNKDTSLTVDRAVIQNNTEALTVKVSDIIFVEEVVDPD